jgi:hypothetical protein
MDGLFGLYSYRMETCNAIAHDIALSENPESTDSWREVIQNYEMDLGELSEYEVEYIVRTVDKLLS